MVKMIITAVSLLGALTIISCKDTTMSMPDDEAGMKMNYSMPAGSAWAEGKEVRFTHTEVSDSALSVLLTNMMNSPVLLVPSLAHIPDSLLANVYVFSNGVAGEGPLDYQADIFDKPASSAGYTPLRRLNVVTWKTPSEAIVLKSEEEVLKAVEKGSVTVEKKPVVINMPFVVWSTGQR